MDVKGMYKNISNKNIINNVYSKYWIYEFEDKIVQNAGGTYRHLTIFFFDRNPNVKEKLNKIELNINGSTIMVQNFKYNNSEAFPQISCEIMIDLETPFNNIFISKYVINDELITLSPNYYIQGLIYRGDDGKYNVCKDILKETSFTIAPEYNNMLWYCGCGYANMLDDTYCAHCNQSKSKMISIADASKEELVLNKAASSFVIDCNMPVENKLKQYAQNIEGKYGVSKDKIIAQFDMTELKRKQQELVDKTIVDYLNTNDIHFNYEKTFEENMDEYFSGIVKGIIYKNDVKKYLEMDQLASKYVDGKKQYDDEKKKAANKKKIMLVIGGIAAVAIVLLASIGLIKQQEHIKNNSAVGVEIKDTKENREILYENILIEKIDVEEDYFAYGNSPICENIDKYFEEKSIYSINDLLYDQKIIASTKFLTNNPKETEIQEFGNKKFIAINKEQFIVQETVKVDDTTNKIYVYIGDKQGKPILGYYEDTYVEQKLLSDSKLVSEEILYADRLEYQKYTYQYEGENLKKMFIYNHPMIDDQTDYTEWYLGTETIFEDGKPIIVNKYYDDGIQYASYKLNYNGDTLVSALDEMISVGHEEIFFTNNKITKVISTTTYGYKYEYTYYYSETGQYKGYLTQGYDNDVLYYQYLYRIYDYNEYGLQAQAGFHLNQNGDYVLSLLSLSNTDNGMQLYSLFNINTLSDFTLGELNNFSDYHTTIYDANVYYDLSSTTVTTPEEDLEEDYVLDLEQDYLFPGDRMLIQESDLEGLSELEVSLIRNELYARHGYEFKTEPFKSYFNGKEWYRVNEDFNEIDDFNDIEIANRDFLIQYEIDKGWREE